MKIVRKITEGFVVQEFDYKTGKLLGQSFHANTNVEFEDAGGTLLDPEHTPGLDELYSPFGMVVE